MLEGSILSWELQKQLIPRKQIIFQCSSSTFLGFCAQVYGRWVQFLNLGPAIPKLMSWAIEAETLEAQALVNPIRRINQGIQGHSSIGLETLGYSWNINNPIGLHHGG